jgi:RNA polymerase sigma-70 factor (ECF subfamily)
LLAVLDPDVVLRAQMAGTAIQLRGAAEVAGQAAGYSRLGLDMRPLLINGAAGVVAYRDGKPFSVGGVIVRGGRIVAIDILADPARLVALGF